MSKSWNVWCLCFHCNYSLKDFCLFDTWFMKRYVIFLHGIDINRFFSILYNSIKYNISLDVFTYYTPKNYFKITILLVLYTLSLCMYNIIKYTYIICILV